MKHLQGGQKGFILPTILVMAVVLAIFASALYVLLTSEMRNTSQTRSKDLNAQAADAAFQRAIAMLNAPSTSNWSSMGGNAYSSLTTYPYAEIPGVVYSISIAAGELVNTGAAKALTTLWPNQGDINFDRTIFVRVKATLSNREDNMVAKIHRNVNPFILGDAGIYTTGCQDLGTVWHGNSFDSCNGSAGTGQTSADCIGNMTAPCFSGGGNLCLNQNPVPTVSPPPTPSLPVGATPTPRAVPGNVTVLQDITGSVTLGPAPSDDGMTYQVANINTNGGDTITFDESSGGPIILYVTGYIDMGGHSGFAFTGGGLDCCKAASAGIFVIGGGDVSFNGNTSFVGFLYAPDSAISVSGGGTGTFEGVIVAETFNINAGGAGWFHYDRCLLRNRINTYNNPPVIINAWQTY